MISLFHDYKLLKKFPSFCDKLTKLLDSGLDIEKSLEIIYKDESDPEFKEKIALLSSKLYYGESFTANLKIILPDQIPFNFSHLSRIPDLSIFLRELSIYYSEKTSTIKKLISQLTYPCFLIITTMAVFVLLITVILPSYEKFFSNMTIPVPAFLHYMMNITSAVQTNLSFIIIIALLIILFFSHKITYHSKNFIYKLFFPYRISDLLWLISIFLQSGTDLKQTLESIYSNNENPFLDKFNYFIREFFSSGDFALKFHKIFSTSSYQKELLLTGEKTGMLHKSLLEIAKDIKLKEQEKLYFILNTIQPSILLFLGIIICFFIYISFIPVLQSIQKVI
ncbi:MAG: hypothetical protein GY730_04750 [bacterium]|nr:hypothetical protein [bacterium]